MAGNHAFIALTTIQANGAPAPMGVQVKGKDWLVPCIDVSHLSQREAEAYGIADNRTSDLAANDEERLIEILKDISGETGDLSGTGYDDSDLQTLINEYARTQREYLDDPGAEDPDTDDFGDIRVEPGDIWALGDHRILCGDSTSLEDVRRLLDGKRPKLVATDPPYLVDYTGDNRPADSKDWSDHYHENEIKDAEGFYRSVFANILDVSEPNAAIYCWHASRRSALLEAIWDDLGILYHQQIVWVKPSPVMSYSVYFWQHEPCLMGWRKGFKPDRCQTYSGEHTSVWHVDHEGKARASESLHPTQKPAELFAIPIRMHTTPGDLVFEPFSGSGSQIIAAHKEARVCYAIELEPRFCEVAIRRWEALTGETAELVSRHGGELR